MFKKILLFIEKKADLLYFGLLGISFLYVIIEKITFDKNILNIHFFNSFSDSVLARIIETFIFIVLIGTIQIKDGKLSIRPDRSTPRYY